MIRDAEVHGLKAEPIVEATSGNTGAALAMVAAIRGYKCVFVMPDKMYREKIAGAYGAKVVVCPTAVEPDDPRSYYQVAKRIAEERRTASTASTATNRIRRLTTCRQVRRFGISVATSSTSSAGMGTGGTISIASASSSSRRSPTSSWWASTRWVLYTTT